MITRQEVMIDLWKINKNKQIKQTTNIITLSLDNMKQ